jgi:hypothetical protein
MDDLQIHGGPPLTEDLCRAIEAAADALDLNECYAHDGRYHFTLGGGWSIALSADSAERVRVQACLLCSPRDTVWALAHRTDRIAALVRRLSAGLRETV